MHFSLWAATQKENSHYVRLLPIRSVDYLDYPGHNVFCCSEHHLLNASEVPSTSVILKRRQISLYQYLQKCEIYNKTIIIILQLREKICIIRFGGELSLKYISRLTLFNNNNLHIGTYIQIKHALPSFERFSVGQTEMVQYVGTQHYLDSCQQTHCLSQTQQDHSLLSLIVFKGCTMLKEGFGFLVCIQAAILNNRNIYLF